MSAPLVPLHPEPVAGDDHTLRWVVPVGVLDFVGAPREVPACLQTLLDDGTIEALAVEPAAVRIRLSAPASWRVDGPRMRAAVQEALAVPEQWSPVGNGSPDEVLRMAVQEVIDGDVGAYVRSHGGDVALLEVHDGEVDVRLSGTCTHCPASDVTLTDRFETAVRARYPALRAVRARDDTAPGGVRRLLSLTPLRRR